MNCAEKMIHIFHSLRYVYWIISVDFVIEVMYGAYLELAVTFQLNNELLTTIYKIKFVHINSEVCKDLVQITPLYLRVSYY